MTIGMLCGSPAPQFSRQLALGLRAGAGRLTIAMPAPHDTRAIDPAVWCRLVDAANGASLLVVIRSKMSPLMLSRHAPEDVLQESLLQAWRDRAGASFDSAPAFRSWLLTIIDHRIRDLAEHDGASKRGGGHAPVPIDHAAEPSGSTTPARLAVFREQAAAMIEALEAVPSEYRDVVRLRLFHQMPLAQIAEGLNIGLGAVRARFRHGAIIYRERLRSAIVSRSHGPGVPHDRLAAPASAHPATQV